MADPGPFKRPLYPPSHDKGPVPNGADVEAVKRAISRAGFFPWQEFDRAYNEKISDAVKDFQKANGLDSTGNYGEATHNKLKSKNVPSGKPNAGEDVFDKTAADLYKGYKPPPDTSDEDKVRKYLTEFCERAINEPWDYSQNRAIDVTVDPDDDNVDSDCSGSVIQAYNYAKRKSGINVPDPSKYGYAGWGNTWDDEDGHPKVTNGQFRVGDLAHYDGHVCLCFHAGNADTSDWFSFGSEPPSKRKLHYRTDFKFVVRPPMSPSRDTYSTTFEKFTFRFRIWKLQRIVLFWKNGKRRGDPPTD